MAAIPLTLAGLSRAKGYFDLVRARSRRGQMWSQKLNFFRTKTGFGSSVTIALVVGLLATAPARSEVAEGKYSGFVVDGKSAKILYQSEPDALRYPASLTKMMTLYLLFEAIDSGKVSLSSKFSVSGNAAAQAPSKLEIKPGDSISAKDAILSLVTLSANDVAVVIAENLAGSENAFAARMTAAARAIGMSRTTFRNASGLPNPGQVTTARDMATLGRALRDRFPLHYGYFSTRSFVWRGREIGSHNRLLGRVDGVDGIKTGYTRASGYNLVTSLKDDKRYVVGVVMGGRTGAARDAQMEGLLEQYLPRATTGPRTAPLLVASTAPRLSQSASPAPVLARQPEPAKAAKIVTPPPALAEGDTDDDDRPVMQKPGLAGWKIQIGALPSEDQAKAMIAKAKAAAPTLLASASAFTEPVGKGASTLYRARFGGFAGREDARAACEKLMQKELSCLAVQ